MRYKVWVQIEQVDNKGGQSADAGKLGILPDPLGSFNTLGEAVRLQAAVVASYNPATMGESDAVAWISDSESRLGEVLASEVWEQ